MRSLPTGEESTRALFRPSAGTPNDSKEFQRVKTGAADEEAVHVRLRDQAGGVLRRRRAAVEDRHGGRGRFPQQLAELAAQEAVGFLRGLRSRGVAGADRPYRLIGKREGIGPAGEGRAELALEHLEGPAGTALVAALAQADHRRQAMARRGHGLAAHELVPLAVVPPAFAVAAEGPGAAGVGELQRRDVASEGAALLRVDVLASHLHLAVHQLARDDRDEREGREDRHPDVDDGRCREAAPQVAAVFRGVLLEQVHLPVGGHQRPPPRRAQHIFSSTATPGSVRPARNSREAPPPVETWPMRSSTPACLTAATVSPPPITENPGKAASAWATSRVPASKGGFSKTPSGPFQNSVRARPTAAAKAFRVSVPTSTAFIPSGTLSTVTVLIRCGFSRSSVTTRSSGSNTCFPWALARSRISRASSMRSGSKSEAPTPLPRAARKVLAMPPPSSRASRRGR